MRDIEISLIFVLREKFLFYIDKKETIAYTYYS